jgi:tRNA dimethylallyltransferase
MRSVGYYQVWQYLDAIITKDELVAMAQAATRQLAKRQITWLRSMEVINVAAESFTLDAIFAKMCCSISNWNKTGNLKVE